MERLINNSNNLQKAFLDVYREFFSKSSIITSASGSFFFCGEYLVLFGGLAIKQKLPTNLYIGLEPIEENNFKIVSAKYLDFTKNWENLNEKHIFEKISQFIKEEFKREKLNYSFNCHILSEIPPGCGLASSGAFGGALAGALLIANEIISQRDIEDFKNLKIENLIKNEKFNKIFRLAWKIESVIHNGKSSGAGPFVSLVWSNYPIIFFSEKRKINFQSESNDTDKIDFFAFSLDKLLKIEEKINWPIDFGLVYSGNAKSTGITIDEIQNIQQEMKEVASFTKRKFHDQLINYKEKIFFSNLIFNEKKEDNWENFLYFANEISLECLFFLSKLLQKKYDNSILINFFRSLNRYHNILQFLRVTNPAINRIREHLNYYANQMDPELGGAAKLTGAGKD